MNHPTSNPDDNRTDYQKYYEAVEVAADCIQEVLDDDPSLEVSDLVWEQVDTSQYILYYSKNLTVLRVSDNEPHEWKHLVGDDDSWRDVLQAMAYKTMEQDLYDELRDRDVV